MAKQEKEIERWVTVNGVRVPIFKDGSVGGPKAIADKIKKNGKKESKNKDDGSKERLSTYERQLAEVNDELANAPKSKALRNEEGIKELEKKKAQLESYIAREKKSKQIDKDNDLKEKQIKQNEAERDKLNGVKTNTKSFHENTAVDGTPIITEYTKLKDVLDAGYTMVDGMTWEPITDKLTDSQVRSKFEGGEIGFIKKTKKSKKNK